MVVADRASMRSLLTFSFLSLLVACGGATDSANDSVPNVAPGASGPPDALACTNEPRLTEMTKDPRPALAQIVTDGTFAYWSRRGAGSAVEDEVVRAPLAGGAVEILVTGASVQGLALDETHVYWTEQSNDRAGDPRIVARIAKAGGAVEVIVSRESLLASHEDDPSDVEVLMATRIAVDGDAVVFGARIDGAPFGSRYGVFRAAKAPPSEGVRAELASLVDDEHDSPVALVVDATSVYWVSGTYDGRDASDSRRASLRSADKHAGGSEKVLAEGSTFDSKNRDVRFGLAIDDGNLYWLSQHDGAVMKIAKSGGAPVVLAADQRDFTSIALGGGFVYWGWRADSGEPVGGIRRVPEGGGPIETLAEDVDLLGIAYDPSGLLVAGSTFLRLKTCP